MEEVAEPESIRRKREELKQGSPDVQWFGNHYLDITRDLAADHPTPAIRELADAIPVGVTFAGIHRERPSPRTEANALVAYCLRNGGPLEDYHAGARPIGQAEMKTLMITASRRVEAWLRVREACMQREPGVWWAWVNAYHYMYCKRWSMK